MGDYHSNGKLMVSLPKGEMGVNGNEAVNVISSPGVRHPLL